jgi:hypothetical protein
MLRGEMPAIEQRAPPVFGDEAVGRIQAIGIKPPRVEACRSAIVSRSRRPSPLNARERRAGRLRRRQTQKGLKLHLTIDTLGHLLALTSRQQTLTTRVEVGRIAKAI